MENISPDSKPASQTTPVEKERSLRDELAIERTRLAQERTHLAYIRTGITLMLGGIFFIGYFPEGSIYLWVGYATIAVALMFEIYGFYNHKKTRRFIDTMVNEILMGER